MSIYFQYTISINTFMLGFYEHTPILMHPDIPPFPMNLDTPNIILCHETLLRMLGFTKSEVLKYFLEERSHV